MFVRVLIHPCKIPIMVSKNILVVMNQYDCRTVVKNDLKVNIKVNKSVYIASRPYQFC